MWSVLVVYEELLGFKTNLKIHMTSPSHASRVYPFAIVPVTDILEPHIPVAPPLCYHDKPSPNALHSLRYEVHLQIRLSRRHSCCPRRGNRHCRPLLSPRDLLFNETAKPRKRLQQRAAIVFLDIVPPRRDMGVGPGVVEPRVLVVVLQDVIVLPIGHASERIIWLLGRGLDGWFEALDEEGRGVSRAVGSVGAKGVSGWIRLLRVGQLLALPLRGRPPGRAPLQHDALRFARDGFGVAVALSELVQDLLLACLALPALFFFLAPRRVAPLPGLVLLGRFPGFEGCAFLGLEAGVMGDGVGVLRGVGRELGFAGGDVDVVE